MPMPTRLRAERRKRKCCKKCPPGTKCGGPGGTPGPCPEGNHDTTSAPDHRTRLVEASEKLGHEVQNDPKAKATAQGVASKITAKLKNVALDEFPRWALDTCDLWLFEDVINHQQSGSVMAVKAAAWGATQAWLGIRKLIGKSMDNEGDAVAKLRQLLGIIAEGAGFDVPDDARIKELMDKVKNDGLDKPEADRRGDTAPAGTGGVDAGKTLLIPAEYRKYRLKEMGVEVHDYDASITVDESKMCATGVLSTTARDRQGDILEVQGIDTTYHKLNPIALLDHGLRYALPIGRCVDPETGQYTVVIGTDTCVQTTYFNQHSEVAEQVFRLIADKTLIGNSIGFREIEARKLPADPQTGHQAGKHILRCELLEATWTALPANQEAVQSILENGIAGKALAPAVKSLLLPFTLPKKIWAPGMRFSESTVDTSMKKEYMSAVDQSAGGSYVSPGGEEHKDDLDTAPEQEQDDNVPHGSKCMKELHEGLKYVKELIEEHSPKMEHPEVKKLTAKLLPKLEEHIKSIQETHDKNYPEQEPLGEKSDNEEETKSEDEETQDEEPEEKELDEDTEQKALKLLKRLSTKLAETQKKYHQLTGR